MKVKFKNPIQFGAMSIHDETILVGFANGTVEYLLSKEFEMKLNIDHPFQLVDVYLDKYNQWLAVCKEFVIIIKD